MATLVVNSNSYIRPYKAGKVRIVHYAPASGQDYEIGDILVESTGKVQEAGADPSPIIGVAAAASREDDGEDAVWVADESGEFLAHVEDGMTPTIGMVGLACGLVKDSSNDIWRVDTSDTSNTAVVITEIVNLGDVNGRVAFRFIAADRAIYQ